MSLPDKLDPFTLGWLADEIAAEAEVAHRRANDLALQDLHRTPEPPWYTTQILDLRGRAAEFRKRVKRLRAIATRIERRRGGR